MEGTISSIRLEYRTKGFADFAERVMRDHKDAKKAWAVDDLVSEMLGHMKWLRQTRVDYKHRVMSGEITEIDETGHSLLDAYNSAVQRLSELEDFVRWFSNEYGYKVERASVFKREFAEIKKEREWLRRNWPWTPTPDENAGTRPIQDLIDELRSRGQ